MNLNELFEAIDTGEHDARKTQPSSKEQQDKVFARHRERVKNLDQDKKSDVNEVSIPDHIKPSDIPPTMRNRKLTMKDVEAERPKGAYRFKVGEKYFMGLDAAKDFAAGTGEKVERVAETKKDRSPGKISKSEDPCWSGYHMVGTKKKGGREVPNCVPGEKGAANESVKAGHGVRVQRGGPSEDPVQA